MFSTEALRNYSSEAEVAYIWTVNEKDEAAQDDKEKTEEVNSAEIMDYESSEGVFRVTVPVTQNKLSRKLSAGYKVNNLTWKLDIRYEVHHLAVFLCCHANKIDPTQKVYCEYHLKLINPGDGQQSITKNCSYVFTVGESHGYGKFVSYSDLLSSKKMFVKDNEITIECYLACGSVQHILPKSVGSPVTTGKNLHSVSWSERAKHLLDSGVGCDCVFIVSDGKKTCRRRACKFLLAVASPVFEAMFFGPWKEDKPITITDIDVDAFYVMLYYIHGAVWAFDSQAQAVSVYYAAKKYLISDLEAVCVNYIWPQKVDNVWLAFDFATMYQLDDLKNAAMKIIKENLGEVFKMKNFLDIRQESILELLQHNELLIDELELFEIVLNWAEFQCEKQGLEKCGVNLRSILGKGVRLIRFLSMTVEQFAGSPCNSGIFSHEEVAVIFQRIVTRRVDLPLPSLCCLQEKRKYSITHFFHLQVDQKKIFHKGGK